MERCIPKYPPRPQEYAEAAPEPEELLLYLTALSKSFFFNLPNQFCNPMQTFSIHCPKGRAPQVNHQEEP